MVKSLLTVRYLRKRTSDMKVIVELLRLNCRNACMNVQKYFCLPEGVSGNLAFKVSSTVWAFPFGHVDQSPAIGARQ